MIPHHQIAAYLADQSDVVVNRPFDDPVTVYWLQASPEPIMFAVLSDHPIPRLSLRCDPILMAALRSKYETVGSGHKLNRRVWNTIVLTGQLTWDEIIGLVDHGYQLTLASCESIALDENPRPGAASDSA